LSIYRGFEIVETAVTEIDTVIILLSRAQSCVKCTHVVATLTVKLTEKKKSFLYFSFARERCYSQKVQQTGWVTWVIGKLLNESHGSSSRMTHCRLRF